MLKKLAILVGCLIGAFVIAAIVVPMVVDVDKFRPQIVKAANDNLNGELKLGKLNLSLWGGLRVKIESVALTLAGAEKPLLATDSAYVNVPFWSLLTFHPRATIVLEAPQVEVIKDTDGKMNVMKLMKDPAASASTAAAAERATAEAEKGAAPGGAVAIPAIVANASLGVRITKGNFTYVDRLAKGNYAIQGVELDARNLGLKDTMKIALELPVKGSSPEMKLDGLVTAKANVTPIMSGGAVSSASGDLFVDATKLAFALSKGTVQKTAKMPMTLALDFDGTENDLRIKKAEAKFHEIVVNLKGVVTMKPEQAVKVDVQSSDIPLASLADIVPMLKEYELGGTARLLANADGPVAKIAAKGEFNVKGGKANYPALLKGPVNFEMKSSFTENTFDLAGLAVTGPGSDMALKGTVKNFAAPQFNFALNGKQIDVDKLVKMGEKKTAALPLPALIETAHAAPPAAGVNPMLAMAKNPMLTGMAGVFTVDLDKLLASGATIHDIKARATLKNLVVNLESASLKTFEGLVNAKANADLKTAGLNYSTSGSVKGLSAQNALASFFPKFKNTLEGKVNANWNLRGAAFPETVRMRSLDGTVNVSAENGNLRSIDIQESLAGVMEKVPFLKGKSPPKFDEGFQVMRADLKFAGGVIDANPIEIIGKGRSLTIKGKSKIQENLEQDTYVDVYDPHQLLPKEISNGKDVAVALHITGPISSPQTDYGYTVSRLAKAAIKNEGQKAIQKGLQKILGGNGGGQQTGEAPKGGDAVKDALKKFKIF